MWFISWNMETTKKFCRKIANRLWQTIIQHLQGFLSQSNNNIILNNSFHRCKINITLPRCLVKHSRIITISTNSSPNTTSSKIRHPTMATSINNRFICRQILANDFLELSLSLRSILFHFLQFRSLSGRVNVGVFFSCDY
jgi:hypothetical protein